MKKKLLLFLLTLIAVWPSKADITLGSGTSTGVYPIATNWGYNYTQQIFTASEVQGLAGDITSLKFYLSSTSTSVISTYKDWQVYVGLTSKTSFSSNTDWVAIGDMSLVFNGVITNDNGVVRIPFSSNFAYDGTSNLVVAVFENTASFSGTAGFYSTTPSSGRANQSIYYRSDSSIPNPASPPTAGGRTNAYSNITFVGLSQPCEVGTFSGQSASNITGTSADIAFSFSGLGNNFEYYYSASSTAPTAATAGAATSSFSAHLSGLNPMTPYYFWLRSICEGVPAAWSSAFTFTTGQIPGTIPYSEDFEGQSDWVVLNGTQTNKWFIGAAATGTTGNSLYITDDGGVTNQYSSPSSATSVTWAYRTVAITEADTYSVSFDWKAYGEGTTTLYDYLVAFIAPGGTLPTAGSQSVAGVAVTASSATPTGWSRIGGNYLNFSSVWQRASQEVVLTPGNYNIIFLWVNDGSTNNQPPAAIDNISIVKVACPSPTAANATDIISTGATLAWTAAATSYDYFISTSSTAPTASTVPTETGLTAATKVLTGLSPITNYYFWVRANCAGGTTSSWSAVTTFKTACPVFDTPFVEDFNGTTFPSDCWTRYSGAFTDGKLTSALSTSTTWTYSTSGMSGSKHASLSITSSTTTYWFVTPAILIENNTKELSFDFALTNSSGTALTPNANAQFTVAVSVDGGLSWQSANSTLWRGTALTTISGTRVLVPMSQYSGQTVKIAFIANVTTSSSTTHYFKFDNVKVDEVPSCIRPTDVLSSAITSSGATLAWTGTSPNYEYLISTSATVPTAGTLPSETGLTTASKVLTGLTPNTTYYFWVRGNCGASDVSEWSNVASFKTACGVYTTPFSEDFNGSAFPSDCWTRYSGLFTDNIATTSLSVASAGWITYSSYMNGTKHTKVNVFGTSCAYWLVTPSIAITAGQELTFDLEHTAFGSAAAASGTRIDDKFIVVLSTDDGATWAMANATVWDNAGSAHVFNNIPNTPQEISIDLSAYAGLTVKVAFYAESTIGSNGDNDIHIDNVRIADAPSCIRPTGLSFANITPVSAEATVVDAVGSAWQFAVGATGFTPDDNNVIDAATLVSTLTGLTPGTTHAVYVRSNCSAAGNGTSEWFGPVALTTTCYGLAIDAAATTVCAGSSVTLTAISGGAYAYSWSDGTNVVGTSASIVVTPATTTNYSLTATLGGCVVTAAQVIVVAPVPGVVTITTPAPAAVNTPITLAASVDDFSATVVLFSENFNAAIPAWTLVNHSTGTTPAGAAWTLRPDGYAVSSQTLHSNDNSQFIMSNSDAVGSSSVTATELISPAFAIPANALNPTLKFYHYYRYVSEESATVQISDDNGSNWTNLIVYTTAQGAQAAFALVTLDLTAYIGHTNLKLRFKYDATYDYYWAIDNVTVSADLAELPAITWTPITNLFMDQSGTTPYLAGTEAATVYAIFPAQGSQTYTATAALSNGCTSEATVTAEAAETVDNRQYTTQNVLLYPNPVTSQLFIQSGVAVKSLSVFSATGAKLMDVNGNVSTIDVGSLVQGMYIVQINLIDGNSVKQTIIKR